MMDEQEILGKEAVESTIRTNEFTLVMPGLSNLKFEIQSYSISSGQPWEGISKIECNKEGCTMFVMAGRHGTSATANWFADAIESGSAIGCDTYDTMPGELNFAFKGTLSFDHGGKTYNGNDVVIAQGSNARSRNNWWIGGPKMSIFTVIPPFVAAVGQTFNVHGSIIPAKVTFSTSITNVSSMQVGVIGLME